MGRFVKNENGYSMIGAVLGTSIFSLSLVVGATISVSRTRTSMNQNFFKDRPVAIIDAIVARTIRDLVVEMNNPSTGATPDGTLGHLLAVGSTVFTQTAPRTYGKGEFQIAIQGLPGIRVLGTQASNGFGVGVALASLGGGGSAAPAQIGFMAPETDPQVWLEPGASACKYRVHIKTKLCRGLVAGRTAFTSSSGGVPGLDQPWNVPCPTAYTSTVDHQFMLNTSSPEFAGTSSTACRAPAHDNNPDIPTSLDYWNSLVIHSQQNQTPPCPLGWNAMWSGYSYMGGTLGGGGINHSQDLSDTGSCMERFQPINFIECTAGHCNYKSGGDRSYWLIAQAAAGNPWQASSGNDAKAEEMKQWISRCTVCEGMSPVIVRHALNNEEPACPTGWKRLWQGISYTHSSINAWEENYARAGGTGSCLQLFVPDPILACDSNDCRHGRGIDSKSTWLVDLTKTSDRRVVENEESFEVNAHRVSRCAVCSRF